MVEGVLDKVTIIMGRILMRCLLMGICCLLKRSYSLIRSLGKIGSNRCKSMRDLMRLVRILSVSISILISITIVITTLKTQSNTPPLQPAFNPN